MTGEVWIDRTNLPATVARFYARYPDNRQGRRAAERALEKFGIDKANAQVALDVWKAQQKKAAS